MTFRGEPATFNRQAADWIARLHADDRTDHDKTAFRAWLDADPCHADAFERASAIWDSAGGLTAPMPAARPSLPSRRAVMAGGAALLVAGASSVGWRAANAGVYRTDVGEQRRLVLDDGTRVMLDTDTRIRFRAATDLRTLSLSAGRIDLDVAADRRPFAVQAGGRRVLMQTGRLDIRYDAGQAAVTALDGTARIETSGSSVPLRPGQRIAMADGRPDRVDRPELDDLVAWQTGRLAFRDETLAQATAEMNRYTDRTLVVVDPRAAAMRFTGLYRVGDPEAFARSLAVLLPVRVDADAGVIRISATG
ncbi:FecR family protein [Sphingomonas prati]|uniref:Transmembrane sensor n=1 Tax=Sphingomonas prati TaxID=1843237 RepID=A0A7W9BTY8_9SPHN|nr:FecR domain-containing protein [Sphingomonas prati]MBB5730077.1 transmembrane sensor [Sphingomonas prati]GGE91259.1 peptide ABC transporter substrate-binding protein [Sphingomonas prati]